MEGERNLLPISQEEKLEKVRIQLIDYTHVHVSIAPSPVTEMYCKALSSIWGSLWIMVTDYLTS